MLTLIVKTGSSHLKLLCIDAHHSAGTGYVMNHTVDSESVLMLTLVIFPSAYFSDIFLLMADSVPVKTVSKWRI